MSEDAILNEDIITGSGDDELLTTLELLTHVIEDISNGIGPDDVAEEFISEFVEAGRPETDQVLSLLDQPTPVLVMGLKNLLQQTHQEALAKIDEVGPAFTDGLKTLVKARLQKLADKQVEL